MVVALICAVLCAFPCKLWALYNLIFYAVWQRGVNKRLNVGMRSIVH